MIRQTIADFSTMAIVLLFAIASFTHPSWSTTSPIGSPEYHQFPCNPLKGCTHDTVINGTHYFIPYGIQGEPYGDPEGVKLVNITASTELKALLVNIESNQNGGFRIDLPWKTVEAMGLDRNADFIALVDGKQVDRGIASSPETVILTVEFESGARQILLGDSRIIPEFGTLSLSLAAIAIVIALVAVVVGIRLNAHSRTSPVQA